MTTTTETLTEERDRLDAELAELRRAVLDAGGVTTPEQDERYAAVRARLREIAAIPPEGYRLPSAAAGLISHAEAHGWLALAQWARDSASNPFVTVQVGRKLTEAEATEHRGDTWLFKFTWHSRDCPPCRLRLFGTGTAKTPDEPWTHDAPSVKGVRAVIAEHPAA